MRGDSAGREDLGRVRGLSPGTCRYRADVPKSRLEGPRAFSMSTLPGHGQRVGHSRVRDRIEAAPPVPRATEEVSSDPRSIGEGSGVLRPAHQFHTLLSPSTWSRSVLDAVEEERPVLLSNSSRRKLHRGTLQGPRPWRAAWGTSSSPKKRHWAPKRGGRLSQTPTTCSLHVRLQYLAGGRLGLRCD